MSKGIALITGLNGHIAGPTAEAVLKAGFDVRGTVRRSASGIPIKEELERRGYAGRVEITEVPDMTVEGAFDKAVEGCSAIFHLAGPVSDVFLLPATQVVETGIKSIRWLLNSATQHAGPQLKSVVFVSSVAATAAVGGGKKAFDEEGWNESSPADFADKGDAADGVVAYQTSKTLAEREFWKFHAEKKRPFSMTAVLPVWVLGPYLVPVASPDDVCFSLNQIRGYLMSGQVQDPMQGFSSFIDVRDVAKTLTWAATTRDVSDGQRYIVASFQGHGQAVADILWKDAPEIVQGFDKGNPGVGYSADYSPNGDFGWADARKIAKATGFEWIPYEQSVVDSAKSLLHLKNTKFSQRYMDMMASLQARQQATGVQ